MANWIQVNEDDFHAHINEVRAEKRVYDEYMQADRTRIYWVGYSHYTSPWADWIAKIEIKGNKSHYYIAEP